MVDGFFWPVLGASVDAIEKALAALPRPKAVTGAAAKAKAKAPRVQRRVVTAEYSQVQLEPASRTKAEAGLVYFQKRGESAQGMSIFPTMVGIATPSETERVDARITIASRAPAIGRAVQAVAFPLTVRGPLHLRSVSDDDEDLAPLIVPPGSYDVMAAFSRAKASRAAARSGLRRFALELTFCPAGSLGAPRCHRLEDGTRPPAKLVVNRG